MYIDMTQYNIEDLKDEREKAFIEGHAEAIEDLEAALDMYLEENDGDIELFVELRKQIAIDVFNFVAACLKSDNDEMLVSFLDRQASKEETKDE